MTTSDADFKSAPELKESDYPKAGWVWRSTPESVAAGQKSILAVIETIPAFCLFWLIASITPMPWLSLLLALAAPLLLLRSDESIAYGAKLLDSYDHPEQKLYLYQVFVIWVLGFLYVAAISYGLTKDWLLGYDGWSFFWRTAFVVVIVVTVVEVGVGVGVRVGLGVGVGVVMAFARLVAVLISPVWLLSFFIPSLLIRLWATRRYWREGLKRFSRNAHETLWVIDHKHHPQLVVVNK